MEEEKKSVNYTVKDLPKVLAFIEDNAARKTTEKDDLTKKKHELTEELSKLFKRLNFLFQFKFLFMMPIARGKSLIT